MGSAGEMSRAEIVWIVAPWGALLVLLLAFTQYRQKTEDYTEAQAFKTALAGWVGLIERIVALAWAFAWGVSIWKLYSLFLGHSPAGDSSTAGKLFVVVGIGIIIVPLALLCANAVSWAIPPLRHANQRAFRGKNVSFGSLNLGLIKGALVSLPVGVAALIVAAIRPWSGQRLFRPVGLLVRRERPRSHLVCIGLRRRTHPLGEIVVPLHETRRAFEEAEHVLGDQHLPVAFG